jgi:hypothetical protein
VMFCGREVILESNQPSLLEGARLLVARLELDLAGSIDCPDDPGALLLGTCCYPSERNLQPEEGGCLYSR